MNKLIRLAALLEKIAVTFEEYKHEHPGTKKTKSDPMFNHAEEAAKHRALQKHHSDKATQTKDELDNHYHGAKSDYHSDHAEYHETMAKGQAYTRRKPDSEFSSFVQGLGFDKGDGSYGDDEYQSKVKTHAINKHNQENGIAPTKEHPAQKSVRKNSEPLEHHELDTVSKINEWAEKGYKGDYGAYERSRGSGDSGSIHYHSAVKKHGDGTLNFGVDMGSANPHTALEHLKKHVGEKYHVYHNPKARDNVKLVPRGPIRRHESEEGLEMTKV